MTIKDAAGIKLRREFVVGVALPAGENPPAFRVAPFFKEGN